MPDHSPTLTLRKAAQQAPEQRIIMKQTWSELLFLHWEFDVKVIQETLPEGLYVDKFQEKAYLGIVPFLMQKIRPIGFPAIPKLSWFHELNLRTYVHDENGKPGVWFYSLDCDQPIAVELARKLFHLPYQHAQMNFEREQEERYFTSQRRESNIPQQFSYQPKSDSYYPATDESLEFFLVERYFLYSVDRKGRLCSGQVHHTPYQIQEAEVTEYSKELFNLEGFPLPEGKPCSQLIAKPVDVSVYPLTR